MTPTKPPRERSRKKAPSTGRDMLISLAVVGAAIGTFVLLLPKTPHAKVTPVDYLPAAQRLARDTTLAIYAPQPLPKGWQSNYIRFSSGPDGLHIGFVLNAERFARLDESAKPDAAYYQASHVPAQIAAGASLLAGYQVRLGGGHVALVKQLPGGGVLTISDGGTSTGASLSELVTLAKSLREQSG